MGVMAAAGPKPCKVKSLRLTWAFIVDSFIEHFCRSKKIFEPLKVFLSSDDCTSQTITMGGDCFLFSTGDDGKVTAELPEFLAKLDPLLTLPHLSEVQQAVDQPGVALAV